jgi:hypothetical protein
MDEKYLHKEGESSMPETPQELIDNTTADVQKILEKHFPDYLNFENGSFTISRGSSQVMIIVRPFTENETCIECVSNVVTGANITNELMQFLLRKNAELHFGAFGLLFDNTIVFQHTITGTNLNENELRTSINAVAIISDHYDDEIVEMAGGKRAIDLGEEDMEA